MASCNASGVRTPTRRKKALRRVECFLNWGQVGGVGRQKQELASSRFNDLPNIFADMRAQIGPDHDLSSLQTGGENLFNVTFKNSRIRSRRSWDEGFAHPGASESDASSVIFALLLRGTEL